MRLIQNVSFCYNSARRNSGREVLAGGFVRGVQ
jgi:hypothetical protein